MWPWFNCKFLPIIQKQIGQTQPCGNSKQLNSSKSQNSDVLSSQHFSMLSTSKYMYSNHQVPGSSFEFCLGKTYFLWVKRILPMIYISEYSWIWICRVPATPPAPLIALLPPSSPVFRFGCRLLLLSSQQALKASPFTTGIINIICRYGNLHFSNLSLGPFCMQSNSKSDQKVWETIQN